METPQTPVSAAAAPDLAADKVAAIYGGTAPEDSEPEVTAPEPPPSPDPSPAPEPPAEAPDPVAEAEERGYRRGRREAAAAMMERPAMWHPAAPTAPAAARFLATPRPSVWD